MNYLDNFCLNSLVMLLRPLGIFLQIPSCNLPGTAQRYFSECLPGILGEVLAFSSILFLEITSAFFLVFFENNYTKFRPKFFLGNLLALLWNFILRNICFIFLNGFWDFFQKSLQVIFLELLRDFFQKFLRKFIQNVYREFFWRFFREVLRK